MEERREEEHMQESLAENDDSYIEIELDSCAVVVPTCVSSEDEDDKIIDDEDQKVSQESEEYDELRISISSTIALLDVHNDQQCVVDSSEKSETSVDPSSASSGLPPLRKSDSAESDPGLVLTQRDDDQRRVKLPSNFKVDFCENRSSDHTHITLHTTMPLNSCNDMGLHSPTRHNRVKEGSVRRRNGGMIMRMLIKFRGIKLSTLISSLIKPPPRAPCQDHNKGHTKKSCRAILQCYHQKNMVVNPSSGSSQEDRLSSKRSVEEATTRRLSKLYWDLNSNKNNNNISSSNEGSFRSSRRSSWNRSAVEIDLGALKGMFSAVGIAQKGTSSSNKRKSCSTMSSCDNSPIHEGFSFTCTTDNSIQAAIAYCKTSFGQTSDFSF